MIINLYPTTSRECGPFLAGVIEGFYGQPWTQPQRLELFDSMVHWGLNTYMYAPKDDLKHRALWREQYTSTELDTLRELIAACAKRGISFIYALSPGLDIHYSQESDRTQICKRFGELLRLGCRHFALLFDDIPDRLDAEDLRRWGTLASAQSNAANSVAKWLRSPDSKARLLFCPTPYCGRMAKAKLGGENYLQTIGRELIEGVDVFWTGPEIISEEITVEHIADLRNVIRRKPVIWDNLHANDYDGRRFYCGPYSGRPAELRQMLGGILSNPNNEFPLNYVPIRTLAEYVHCNNVWNPRQAYLAAMADWSRSFATIRHVPDLQDVILFGDCYYLPYEDGQEAQHLLRAIAELIGSGESSEKESERITLIGRLKQFCAQLSELRDRSLFYALSRRAWELREELELISKYVELKSQANLQGRTPTSDYHLPGTFRGGMVAKLQQKLMQNPNGTFTPDLQPCSKLQESSRST